MTAKLSSATKVDLFGIPVHALTMSQALDILDEVIQKRKQLQIGVVNAAKIVNMQRNEMLKEDVLSSDLILADGLAVVWASRVLGRPLPERVTGIDLMFGLLKRGNMKGYRVYCFGATEEVSEQVEQQIKKRYPNVNLVGRRNGYYSDADEEQIAETMAKAEPDILFVAITSPKKENFLARWSDTIGASVCHGVGGSFDVMAGKVQRAPDMWQKLGLEWLYRVKQEPRRLWRRYLVTNSLFIWITIKEVFRLKLSRSTKK